MRRLRPYCARVSPRPATIRVAFALQTAFAAILLVLIGLAIAWSVNYHALIDQAVLNVGDSGGEADYERASALRTCLVACGLLGVLAGWAGVTAFGVRRGSGVARILTLVGLATPLLVGLLLSLGAGLLALVALPLLFGVGSEDPIPADEDYYYPDDPAMYPDWGVSRFYDELDKLSTTSTWQAVTDVGAVTLVATLGLLAVAITVLLLHRTSHGYFNRGTARPGPPQPWPPQPWPAPFTGPLPGPLPWPPATVTWNPPSPSWQRHPGAAPQPAAETPDPPTSAIPAPPEPPAAPGSSGEADPAAGK